MLTDQQSAAELYWKWRNNTKNLWRILTEGWQWERWITWILHQSPNTTTAAALIDEVFKLSITHHLLSCPPHPPIIELRSYAVSADQMNLDRWKTLQEKLTVTLLPCVWKLNKKSVLHTCGHRWRLSDTFPNCRSSTSSTRPSARYYWFANHD